MRLAALALLALLAPAGAEELLSPPDFAAGKGSWQGPGTLARSDDDATPVLRVKLSPSRWSILEVRLRSADPTVTLTIELRTSESFAPAKTSREFTPEDFRPGGQYTAPKRVFPKADLLVQLSDERTWIYRPLKLEAGWQTLTTRLTERKSGQPETLALCFPPGDGTVELRRVTLTAP